MIIDAATRFALIAQQIKHGASAVLAVVNKAGVAIIGLLAIGQRLKELLVALLELGVARLLDVGGQLILRNVVGLTVVPDCLIVNNQRVCKAALLG